MPGPTESNGNNKTLLPPISAVPASSLLEPRQDNNEGFSPTPEYGSFVPLSNEFLPLGGGSGAKNEWGEVRGSGFLGRAFAWTAVV